MSENKDEAIKTAQVEGKIRELTEVSRILGNALTLIGETNVRGSQVEPVLEVVNYHRGFKKQVDTQIETLKSTLPKVAKGLDVTENSSLKMEVK